MTQHITHLRRTELTHIQKFFHTRCILGFVVSCLSVCVSLCTFGSFILLTHTHTHNTLTAEILFPCILLVGHLTTRARSIPSLISRLSQSRVALTKLTSYLHREEVVRVWTPRISLHTHTHTHSDTHTHLQPPLIHFQNASFKWSHTHTTNTNKHTHKHKHIPPHAHTYTQTQTKNTPFSFQLKALNIHIQGEHQLICVCGRVGAGKSSLLHALLGEMPKTSGSLTIHGSIAYVSQRPYIVNTTFKENILFGSTSWNAVRYRCVLRSCALEVDVCGLVHGEDTIIGENGCRLSFGQKQRLSLARAVYANKDIYLLDDPMSAVDACVGVCVCMWCVLCVLYNVVCFSLKHFIHSFSLSFFHF